MICNIMPQRRIGHKPIKKLWALVILTLEELYEKKRPFEIGDVTC